MSGGDLNISSFGHTDPARPASTAEIFNVDAIHPGYGFLAESPYFAEICDACNIKFIGPPANVIRMMGDKIEARRVMHEAGSFRE